MNRKSAPHISTHPQYFHYLLFLFLVGVFGACKRLIDSVKPMERKTAITVLCLTIVLGIIFLPVLMMCLKGVKRIILGLQQITLLIFFTIFVVRYFHNTSFIEHYEKMQNQFSEFSWLILRDRMKKRVTFFLENVLVYYGMYFLPFLQSFDVYMMICKPLNYAGFWNKKRISIYLLIGFIACAFFFVEDVVKFGMDIYAHVCGFDPVALIMQRMTYYYRISIYSAVKTCFAKLLYAFGIGRMSFLVRNSLNESLRMTDDNRRGRAALFKRLHCFCLIPQIVNTLNILPETLFLIAKVEEHKRKGCASEKFFDKTETIVLVRLIFFSFGSFAYYFGFLFAFPKVRKIFLCKNTAKE